MPLHYCYGLSVVHSHLSRGASIALTDLSVVDECFWTLFREAGATTLAAVPYTFELLERVGFASMDLPMLRYVTQAGGRLEPERVRHWASVGQARGWDLFVMYGQTEGTARLAYLPPARTSSTRGVSGCRSRAEPSTSSTVSSSTRAPTSCSDTQRRPLTWRSVAPSTACEPAIWDA